MSKTKTPRKTSRQAEDLWICCLCADGECDSTKSFREHVLAAHPELQDGEGKIPARGQMTMHLDGTDFHSTTYNWTLPDGTLLARQTVTCQRAADDPMRDV